MFLHLGGNEVVRTRDVIAVLNVENWPPSLGPAGFKGSKATPADGTKAIVITTKGVYHSPISSGTLKKRAEYLAGLNG